MFGVVAWRTFRRASLNLAARASFLRRYGKRAARRQADAGASPNVREARASNADIELGLRVAFSSPGLRGFTDDGRTPRA